MRHFFTSLLLVSACGGEAFSVEDDLVSAPTSTTLADAGYRADVVNEAIVADTVEASSDTRSEPATDARAEPAVDVGGEPEPTVEAGPRLCVDVGADACPGTAPAGYVWCCTAPPGSVCGVKGATGGDCVKEPPPKCVNGVKDAYEGDVDCGGECPPCDWGRFCWDNSQCVKGSTCNGNPRRCS